ncbi:[protein-PII] uridylyltransferase [Algimonas porphyrae]|uniref:Bifunctional uridylyltransferase/uridylyl-removing enzyme n=1 Tax=Algimonas porphyrae TaxID=1128113 RepID=A0ABQ5UZE8_9PROT|nr:[protein-PII] uridylyltransferase [Algimonas porphyrae]GLQ20636.1 bifunctional uridylyltransferase/uridylyl-removing enzyme [Algimonas porphyrae]
MPRRLLSIPEREAAPDTGIEGDILRQDLSAAADLADSRKAVLSILGETLSAAMELARERFDRGRLDGLETARLISAIHDDIVMALWDYATTHEIRASNPTESERIALCAVGGYGRSEMAPFSDLDLLFLTNDKKASPYVERLTEFVLYMLWDLGLKVGHAVRTVDQSIKLAKEDQTILTALLDVRVLRGDRALASELYTRFRRDITKGSGRAYIAGKLSERDDRHAREGHSRYVIEPNIKEGKGGLRDLHVLYWIARYLDREGQLADPQQAEDYVGMGLFDKAAATRFQRAADFLWRARHNLHWMSGRATETLSFDRQVELCRLMGHASGPVEVAVERFMREYFTNAKEVGALTRIACAKLEASRAIKIPSLYALLPGSRRDLKNPNLTLTHGRLNFKDPLLIKNDPGVILQLFETAGRRNLDIHPDALSAINFRRNLIDSDFRRDPDNAALFQRLLQTAKAPAATLRLMNEAGVLGRYLPEFGGIVARTQFNMHHAYTVDEHTLRLVDQADNLFDGRLEDEIPGPTAVAKSLNKADREIIMLACLLHDTGKGQGDQCIEGAQLARKACRRLGLPKDTVDTVAWLVRSHLEMSEVAQRRDISDPQTIDDFAALMGSQSRLKLLYVLTVCDIRSVGPGVWNDWKGTLLQSLYLTTRDYLEGRTDLDRPARAASLSEQLLDRLSPDRAKRVEPILDRLGPNYWLSFDMTDLTRHARFIDRQLEGGAPVDAILEGVHTRVDRPHDATELWVLCADRRGLFADLAHVIASCGASVAGARLHTGPVGPEGTAQVFNVFYLQNTDGRAFGSRNESGRVNLIERARSVLHKSNDRLSIPTRIGSRRADAIPVVPRVRFSDSAQGDITIVEVEGRDRPGLLAALAAVLRDNDLDVLSAHIEGLGEKAVDAFYVRRQGPDGRLSKADRRRVRADLVAALSDPESVAA